MARRWLLITALMLLTYGYVLPRWADWSQTSRLALVRALVEQHTVRIDAYLDTTGDYALVNGIAYSDKAPGPALLATPLYALLRPLLRSPLASALLEPLARRGAFAATLRVGGDGIDRDRIALAISHYLLTLLVIALPAALSVAGLDWLLRRFFPPAPALAGAFGFGLATPFATYAGNFYSHALVTALLIGAWVLIERSRESGRPWSWLIAAGVCLGLVVASEYPPALIAALLGLYAMYRLGWRAVPALVVGALPGIVLLVAYDLAAFGTPWPVGYAYSALWQHEHHSGLISLTYPHPAALWGLLGGAFRGLFVRAPWLLLAFPGAVAWWRSGRQRSAWLVAVCATCGLILVYSASGMWWGGFAAGPRYIVPALPFLALPAVWWIAHCWNDARWRFLTLLLIGLSLVATTMEAVAGQQFPPDSIGNPWLGWTLPAWQHGDIARNLGMALGLHGAWSLLPLLFVWAFVGALLLRRPQQTVTQEALPSNWSVS